MNESENKNFNELDFKRDTIYWNKYYEKSASMKKPSLFAKFVYENYLTADSELLELGCGNGRDSLYFISKGLKVTAIDASDFVINELIAVSKNTDAKFVCGDFVDSDLIYSAKYDWCYSRFSVHAISEPQENTLLDNVKNSLKRGGKFFVEVRSINDPIYGKGISVGKNSFIYNDHFRRFIDKNEFEKKLLAKGYTVEYSEESTAFAPFGNEKPPVIRVVASI